MRSHVCLSHCTSHWSRFCFGKLLLLWSDSELWCLYWEMQHCTLRVQTHCNMPWSKQFLVCTVPCARLCNTKSHEKECFIWNATRCLSFPDICWFNSLTYSTPLNTGNPAPHKTVQIKVGERTGAFLYWKQLVEWEKVSPDVLCWTLRHF